MTNRARDESVVIRRRMAATREELFNSWTDPEGMARWMCPGAVTGVDVQLEARVGGALRIVMRTETETFDHWGAFTVVDPPARLAFTWHAKATGFQPTLVTVELFEASDGQCDLVLTHARLPRQDVQDQYRGGWGDIIARLDAYLREQD